MGTLEIACGAYVLGFNKTTSWEHKGHHQPHLLICIKFELSDNIIRHHISNIANINVQRSLKPTILSLRLLSVPTDRSALDSRTAPDCASHSVSRFASKRLIMFPSLGRPGVSTVGSQGGAVTGRGTNRGRAAVNGLRVGVAAVGGKGRGEGVGGLRG